MGFFLCTLPLSLLIRLGAGLDDDVVFYVRFHFSSHSLLRLFLRASITFARALSLSHLHLHHRGLGSSAAKFYFGGKLSLCFSCFIVQAFSRRRKCLYRVSSGGGRRGGKKGSLESTSLYLRWIIRSRPFEVSFETYGSG